MPICVWKLIVRIQRQFLWGGVVGGSCKIPWVRWEEVCRPKKDGGLGVKNLMLFNVSLLAKWRWRLLSERDSEWARVLVARYGDVRRPSLNVSRPTKVSLWWKDLVGIGCLRGVEADWIQEAFVKKVGNGGCTSFWHDAWIGEGTLREAFPRLFSISTQSQATIQEVGGWTNGHWRWNFEWRRSLFVWEEELCLRLLGALNAISLSHEDDIWEFGPDREGKYSVKVTYLHLVHKLSPTPFPSLGSVTCRVVAGVWDSWAPSKVVIFSWQALLGRLPTRVNLGRRGVLLNGDHTCVLCGLGCQETEDHLFLLCPFAWKIWWEIYKWFGISEVMPDTIGAMFLSFFGALKVAKKSRKGVVMLWQAVVWGIWRARNDVIFSQKSLVFQEVAEKIKRMSWDWLLAKKSHYPCLYYEWCTNPLYCIVS
jgi:hypothetical protein